MKKLLLLNLFLFVALGSTFAQTIYFSEDFEAGVPADWTVENFTYGTVASQSSQFLNYSGNETNFLAFNDDALGGTHVGGGRVVSPSIDLTAVEAPVLLEINTFFADGDYQGADETFQLSYSLDGGTTWELFKDFEALPWGSIFYEADVLAGKNVMFAFEYDDGGAWNFGCAFDDFVIADAPVNSERRSYTFSINGGGLFNQIIQDMDYQVAGVVTNSGYETINSFDVVVTEGTESETYSFTDMDIPMREAARYELPVTIKADDFKVFTIGIANVNGETEDDENTLDNSASLVLNPVATIHPDKAVLVEEATGTWCTWCPRGTAYMDELSKRFGKHFAGVAVHNGDPMVNEEYDGALGGVLQANMGGYPSVYYNRTNLQDPGAIVAQTIADMSTPPIAKLEVGVDLDGILMQTRLSVSFLEDVSDDYRVFIALTEDGLQGEGAGWNQVSGAYSGGGNGPMAGFEYLPTSVPAAVWPYDHVARALIGGFEGVAGAFGGTYTAGDGDSYIFPDFVLDANWNTENMHVVGVLLDGSGRVVNAVTTKFEDAVANGLTSIEDEINIRTLDIYPNPVVDNVTVSLALETSKNVQISLMNALGQKLSSVNYGDLSGNQKLDYNMANLNAGVYYLNIYVNGELISKKIVKS